jgi:hypothetical protein
MVAGIDTITVTGTNSYGQTVTGTLVVKVNNVVQNNQNNWQGRSIFLRNYDNFQRYMPTKYHKQRPTKRVENCNNFWDKKVKITNRNYRNNNNNNYNYNNNRNYGRYN